MKKIYTFMLTLVIAITTAKAAIHNVQVASNAFTPANFTANVGDIVRWTLVEGLHTSTSQTIPSGAAAWDQTLTLSGTTTFDYTITTPGSYSYLCQFHPGMEGSFIVSQATGTMDKYSSLIGAYPVPFQDRITVSHSSIDAIQINNMTGEIITTINISRLQSETVIELPNIPAGIYLFCSLRDGRIVERRKIIKTDR